MCTNKRSYIKKPNDGSKFKSHKRKKNFRDFYIENVKQKGHNIFNKARSKKL